MTSPDDPVQRAVPSARIALALVLALMACLALRDVSSGDVGFHLAAGSHILDGKGWPRSDPFTFTVGDHAYIDTSWGYQVVLALLERVAGAPGMVLFHVAVLLALFGLVHATARLGTTDAWTPVLLLWLGVLAAEMRYHVRPELISYALLALVLYLLRRREAGRSVALWLLPVIFLVWANVHSLFVLGWIALGCFAVGTWLRDGKPDRRLLGWGAAAVAVTLINPYGFDGVLFPFTLTTRFTDVNPFNQTIGEFQSPFELRLTDQFPFIPRAPLYAFRTFFVLAALGALASLRHRRWTDVLLWAPFAWLSFSMMRNVPLLVVTCLPATAWRLSLERLLAAFRTSAPVRRRFAVGAMTAVTLVSVVTGLRVWSDAYYVATRRPDRFGIGWSRLTQPIDAAAYAERAGLHGRVLNHLNFGGYLMWSRSRPVFIDGRLEVIGEEFFAAYRHALGDAAALEAAVRRYDIEWIVFPYRLTPRLLRRVSDDPDWVLAHVDPLAVVFARRDRFAPGRIDPGVVEALRPRALTGIGELPGLGGGTRPGSVARWLAGCVRRERFPHEPFYLGLFHYGRGETARAAARFAEAISISGGAYYELYQNLGSALYHLGRLEDARACYRIVLDEQPGNRIARERVAEIERRLASR